MFDRLIFLVCVSVVVSFSRGEKHISNNNKKATEKTNTEKKVNTFALSFARKGERESSALSSSLHIICSR